MSKWQPIETAPKRKVVDLWLVSTRSGRGFRVADCQWDKKEKDWAQDGQGFCFHYLVTHWMPLPEPPKGVSHD